MRRWGPRRSDARGGSTGAESNGDATTSIEPIGSATPRICPPRRSSDMRLESAPWCTRRPDGVGRAACVVRPRSRGARRILMLLNVRRALPPYDAIVRLFACVALSTTLVMGAARADAPVIVGEVSTTVGHEEVVPVVRSSLVSELSTVKLPAGKKFIVSASLT